MDFRKGNHATGFYATSGNRPRCRTPAVLGASAPSIRPQGLEGHRPDLGGGQGSSVALGPSLEELRRHDHQAEDPYPDLDSDWNRSNHQRFWNVPTLEALPDIDLAIELTTHYQPESGPMKPPETSG